MIGGWILDSGWWIVDGRTKDEGCVEIGIGIGIGVGPEYRTALEGRHMYM